MSAGTVIEKIEEKAAAEAAAIRGAAEEKAREIGAAILSEAEARAAAIRRGAQEQANRLIAAEKQQCGIETKISMLNEKRRLLKELERASVALAAGFDAEKTTALLTKLAGEAVLAGEVAVGIAEKDAPLFADGTLLQSWSDTFSRQNGKTVTYHLSPEREAIAGGILLYGSHFDVDLSLETVMASVFEAHEKEIADCLFAVGS